MWCYVFDVENANHKKLFKSHVLQKVTIMFQLHANCLGNCWVRVYIHSVLT